MLPNKKGYFQGTEEPTPGKRKYKAEPAIVVQPRFEEPLYRNYDLYNAPGITDHPKHGPGAGWHSMQNYKSISDFLKDRRKKLKDKYKADDSWIQDDGSLTKSQKKIKARMEILTGLVKTAGEHFNKHCKNCGKITTCRCPGPKKTIEVDSCYNCSDVNNIDFPIDDQINSGMIKEDDSSVSGAAQIGGNLDEYLPGPDEEGKLPSELNYGRDYSFENKEDMHDYLQSLLEKYLNYGEEPFYGLPDGLEGMDAREDGLDRVTDNPYGKSESGTTIYDNMSY
jgi:hypothetical protein